MLYRRIVLAMLAAVSASPSLAQSQSGRVPGAATDNPESQHIQRTMTVGSLSLAASRIALRTARFPKLQEFAQFEIAEQETVADVLKALQNSGLVSRTVRSPSDGEVEEHLDGSGREALQLLRSAQAGIAFDNAYLDLQSDGHRELLRVQGDYLGSGHNLENLNVAKLARGLIKEHLQLLADIKKEMTGTTGAAARP